MRRAVEASMREGLIRLERRDETGAVIVSVETVSLPHAIDVAVEHVRRELKDRLRPTMN